MTTLPTAYIEQMRPLLGAEFPAFIDSYSLPRTHGLRLNELKLPADAAAAELDRLGWTSRFGLEPVPWCRTGYYYKEDARPGKEPLHAAGLYYIQEPSAMSAVALLDPQPGDIVLDLAGAPGGKSTQIASALKGEGLLVANEIHPARARILSENIERCGVRNAIVTNASPPQLAERFPRCFDKIMVDAPCSGEGMFRKDPEAIAEWSPAHVQMCAGRQLDIMESAVLMLKPGGILAYSTCTFNREENEQVIAELLARVPDLSVLRTERIWPHRQRGEGHFVCVLQLAENAEASREAVAASRGFEASASVERSGPKEKARRSGGKTNRDGARAEEEAKRRYLAFAEETLRPDAFTLPPGQPLLFGDQLYWLPVPAGSPVGAHTLGGLKVLRPGLHLGEIKKDRFEPSHALALAVPRLSAATRFADLPADGDLPARYLRGEALPAWKDADGWLLVGVEGYPLGWGKQSAGQIKNHFPKGLRR